jgi:lysyl-tRNA synthetase, class II
MFENQYVALRVEKAEQLRAIGKNPYTSISHKNTSCKEFLDNNSALLANPENKDESKQVTIAGRIKFLRLMGKAAFAKVEDESATLQIYYSKNDLEDWFDEITKLAEVGDIIEVTGYAFVTKTGELTMHVKSFEILTKAVSPLPEKFHGLTDMETRYRQRYLDLIMNREVKDVFVERSRIVSFVRKFFEEKGFLEVETPMIHPIAGGANARPFITHHNALGEDKFLRIAPELYLKRLIVGGFEAVFEINRNFRNEGMDHTHNPEFTMIEFYRAYKDFNYLMALTEELVSSLLAHLGKPTKLPYGELEIDFATPFAKVNYKEAVMTIGGVPSEVLASLGTIKAFLSSREIEFDKNINYGQGLAELFDNFVEKKLINPTFITDFPVEISPLAKRSEKDPEITDRFELFMAGKEIANGFNELNDPVDQYNRFKAQVDAKAKGDLEANDMDEDFIEALKYGMPPTAGEGIGIDRLVMLLTNNHSIKDVLLFPAMRKQA